MLGYGGLVLAIVGAVTVIVVGGTSAIAIGILMPLFVTAVLATLPATRNNSLIWLVTGVWTGMVAALTIFSVGIIFLIATVFLLAAFLRASW
jgi:hypothetical protein